MLNLPCRLIDLTGAKMSRSAFTLLSPPVFAAHPLCPPHLRSIVEDAVETFNSAWLLPPQQGEIFDTAKECMRRLQAYALSKDFAVVTITFKLQRSRFACIHYDFKTRNWRGLKDHIEKNDKGTIISRLKRNNTSNNIKNYTKEIY